MTERLEIRIPPGRLIQGNLQTPNETGFEGRALEKPQFFAALAVSKTDQVTGPAVQQVIQQIGQHAHQQYMHAPNVQAQIGQWFAGQFSWKIVDGDTVDKPHHAGCYVFKFTSTIPFRVLDQNNAQMDPANTKRGDYFDVSASVAINGETSDRAGIYLNATYFRFLGFGEAIMSGPTPDEAFGGLPTYIPPGASQAPVGNPPPAGPAIAPAAAPGLAPPPAPSPAPTASPGPNPGLPPINPGAVGQ